MHGSTQNNTPSGSLSTTASPSRYVSFAQRELCLGLAEQFAHFERDGLCEFIKLLTENRRGFLRTAFHCSSVLSLQPLFIHGFRPCNNLLQLRVRMPRKRLDYFLCED